MKTSPKALPFVMAQAAQAQASTLLRLTLQRTNAPRLSRPSSAEPNLLARSDSSVVFPPRTEPIGIYAVDDVPSLTELYKAVLESEGYSVNTFNSRARAIAALSQVGSSPALLITDYLGLGMPVNVFVEACRALCPSLRILMASGFSQSQMHFSRVEPDLFLPKPFTLQQLQQAVKASLNAD